MNVRGVTKPVLDSVTWSHTIFWFFETFGEDVSHYKLCVSTNFIIFGRMDQKLWMFEVFRRSMGMAGICCSQLARVDYISPIRWAARIGNLEKKPLRVSSPIFWSLPLHLEVLNLPFLTEIGGFNFYQNFIFAKIRLHLDLHIHHRDFSLMKKWNHKKFHKNC
jgi:hypothetical protein